MNGTTKGFLITAGIWAALIGAVAIMELLRGNTPFALLEWNVGGKFITFTVLGVLALGTAVGYASDQIQRQKQKGRQG